MTSVPRLVAIGNAPIDLVASVDDAFLAEYSLKKGACTAIDRETLDKFNDTLEFITIEPGGGAANMACCFAALGAKAAFTGKIADDAHGKMFSESLEKHGVALTTTPIPAEEQQTAQIFVLTTADHERTFGTYHGASATLRPDDLNRSLIRGAALTYLDCFTLACEKGYQTMLAAIDAAKSSDSKIVLNTNDPNIVESYKDPIHELLMMADILICNHDEALLLADQRTIEGAVKTLQKTVSSGALTAGREGAYLFNANKTLKQEPPPLPGPVINSNGAGDAFAAGFCFGMMDNYSLENCGYLGGLCAVEILTSKSPRPQGNLAHLLEKLA